MLLSMPFHALIPLADSLQSKLALTKIVIANNGRSFVHEVS